MALLRTGGMRQGSSLRQVVLDDLLNSVNPRWLPWLPFQAVIVPRSNSLRRKLENRFLAERLSRPQDCVREVRMIRRIREVLSLQAEAITMLVDVALLSDDCAVEEVS